MGPPARKRMRTRAYQLTCQSAQVPRPLRRCYGARPPRPAPEISKCAINIRGQIIVAEAGLAPFNRLPRPPLPGTRPKRAPCAYLLQALARTARDRYILAFSARNGSGRIFIDDLRNGRGTMAIGTWSRRARY
jgi:hypothetical protein